MSDDTKKSCLGCPSRLSAEEAGKFFGKSVGGPMCARYGHVLGSAKMLPMAEQMLAEHHGADCKSHGKKKPIEPPSELQTTVFVPHVSVIGNEAETEDDRDMVTTCRNCVFYTPDHVVADKFGWAAGLCNKTGSLLLTSKLREAATGCEYRKYGSWSEDVAPTNQLHLIPIYQRASDYDPSPLGRWKQERREGTFVDPRDYKSDTPVSDEDREFGIRAWRRVDDPHGTGNFTHLPIFDMEKMDPVEREKVPLTGQQEHPEDYIDGDNYVYSVAIEWMELDETPALWGEPGVGKTELARHMAWLMCAPFDRISITKSTEVEDLAGKMMFQDGETKFQWGRLPHRWTKAGVLLLDEPNAGPDDVWQFIRPLTDNSKQLVLDMSGAEKVERHPFCFFTMAMNPAWDFRNAGVQELADADTNRLAHLHMQLPPREVEEVILRTRCEKDGWTPDEDKLQAVLDLAQDIRGLSHDGSLPISWGIRPNIKVIRHLRWFDAMTSYRRAATDFLEPATAQMVLDLVAAKGV